MSVQAMGWALEQGIPRGPKLVLVSICNHANHVDGYCWLNATTIAREASCTPRSVYNVIGALVRNGFIRKTPRRGEDGKQRANDYWVLFDREENKWEWGADHGASEAEGDPSEDGSVQDGDTISSVQTETTSYGENPQPTETQDSRPTVDKQPVSVGPCEVGFSHKSSAEPSESNSKASSAGARVHRSTLRAYRPPPPQPVAEDTEFKKDPIFAFEGTPAYEKWAVVMARKTGIRKWSLTTRAFIEGKDGKPGLWRTGWWFPTLFPPDEKPKESSEQTTGPPKNFNHLTTQDLNEFK